MILDTIIATIDKLSQTQCPVIVGIDGRCASGKTTFAQTLYHRFDANLIHMDDYFLRPEQRTEQRYLEPGGNVDYERFITQVKIPIEENRPYTQQAFDCQKMSLQIINEVPLKNVIIVEGAYSMRPYLRDLYDLKIFFDIDKDEQIQRIKKRNPDSIQMFIQRWIPLEETYFTYYDVQNVCDFTIHTSKNEILL